MGIRLLATSTNDSVRTVSVLDSAIKNNRTIEERDGRPVYQDDNLQRFIDDRSLIHLLEMSPDNPTEPWSGPSYFEVRPLDDYEVTFAIRASGNQSEALGAYDDPNLMLPLLWWMFRMGCTNWENVWKQEDGKNVALEYSANKVANRQSVSEECMKYLPAEVVTDLGGVVLNLSVLTEAEKKASGSSQPTLKSLEDSETNAETIDPVELIQTSG